MLHPKSAAAKVIDPFMVGPLLVGFVEGMSGDGVDVDADGGGADGEGNDETEVDEGRGSNGARHLVQATASFTIAALFALFLSY